jgi:protease-4
MVSLPRQRESLPILLELDLTQEFIEVEPEDPIAKLRSRGKPRLRSVLHTLHEAGDDARVTGLIAKVSNVARPLAQVQELRDAVAVFARSGKPTVAWAETFGESAPGSASYFLASGFSEIWLQQSGELNLIGIATEVQFLRGVLDNLGVRPQVHQRYEYKNAANRFISTEFTDAHREASGRLVESSWEQIVVGVAAARGLEPQRVQELADTAPLLAASALDAGLIDHIGYRDEVYTSTRRKCGGDVRLLYADKWSKPTKPITKIVQQLQQKKAPSVALIDAHGGVVTGKSRRSPMLGQVFGSDTISAAFRAAVKDDKVKAIVFRVDSPGGSYVASDTVWREVVCAREAGKPVVVSMGALAASGGYFVACPADVIVAQPGTLTGSIGVLAGKPVTTGLTDRVGLNYGAVQRGEHARMYSTHAAFSDAELAKLDEFLDHVYQDFTGKVASGRGMSVDEVHSIAKGRVWTGADAAERGLVDELGGLKQALDIARRRGGLPADAPFRPAVVVPAIAKLKSPKSSDDPRAAAAMSTWASGWGEFAVIAERLGLSALGPLVMTGADMRLRMF